MRSVCPYCGRTYSAHFPARGPRRAQYGKHLDANHVELSPRERSLAADLMVREEAAD